MFRWLQVGVTAAWRVSQDGVRRCEARYGSHDGEEYDFPGRGLFRW
jgi:hypothetical protein